MSVECRVCEKKQNKERRKKKAACELYLVQLRAMQQDIGEVRTGCRVCAGATIPQLITYIQWYKNRFN